MILIGKQNLLPIRVNGKRMKGRPARNLESNFSFRLMALSYKLRDALYPRVKVLREVDIQPGSTVLDFGCGSGSYLIPLSKLIGAGGKIYALDRHPEALKQVSKLAARHNLPNVQTIHSDLETKLPAASVDLILLYDVFHHLEEPEKVLQELHRVLKSEGRLSVSDHHLEPDALIKAISETGLFRFNQRGKKTVSFAKVQ